MSALDSISRPVRIVVGDAKDGADPIFWTVAEILEMPRQQFRAEWRVYSRSAGPKRNTRMLNVLRYLRAKGENHLFVLAAWDRQSRGTLNMMNQAKLAKFEVWQITNFKGGL